MIKFILPAVILLTLMISSQALACSPAPDIFSCEVGVVYQGASSTISGRFDLRDEVTRKRVNADACSASCNRKSSTCFLECMQKIAQERAKADACQALCEGEDACVSGCIEEAEFPTLQCRQFNGCAGRFQPPLKDEINPQDTP